MKDSLQLLLLTTAAAGAFAIAVLTLTGALWPSAPDDGRAHLAFAIAASGMGFLSMLFILAGRLIADPAEGSRLIALLNGLAAVLFLVTYGTTSVQINLALNTWFEVEPRMGSGMLTVIRIFVFSSFGGLLMGVAYRVRKIVRR